jgi:hypothetical protein
MKGGLWHSAVASQPCPSGHITADKRLRFTSPKLPSATSFIRRMVNEGLLANNSPQGIWEITEKGRKFYEENKQSMSLSGSFSNYE